MTTWIAMAGLTGVLSVPAGELSPETLLPVHDARDAYTPGTAFGKDVYLVVWQSGRIAAGDLTQGIVGARDIVGCRVEKSGTLLDAAPFVVSGAPDLQERPSAAFGGDVFLAVWQDLRNGKDYDVFAARITTEGKVLDPDGILVSGGPHNQASPRVSWDGKTFLVVWQDFRSNRTYEAYAARVTPAGKVLDPDGVVLASDKSRQRISPVAASAEAGKSFAIWASPEGRPEAGGLFFEDGQVGRQTFVHNDGRNFGPGGRSTPISLAAGGGVYLATWTTQHSVSRAAHHSKSSAALFGADGTRTSDFFLAGKPHRVIAPEAAWDGTAFVCAWGEWVGSGRQGDIRDQVFASRVSAAGEPSEPIHVAGSFENPAREPAVASEGKGGTLIAYEKHPSDADTPIAIGLRMLETKPLP